MKLINQFSEEYSEYLKDESRTIGRASEIAFPREEKEIRDIIKYAYENNMLVTVQGARTGLAAAAVPRGGLILNLSKMNRILICEERDGTFYFTAESGLTLIELNKKIGSKKFDTTGWTDKGIHALHRFLDAPPHFFSPDPTETTCTLGGMAACNASGARSFFYGPTRNHIAAIRVILINGKTLTLNRGENFAKGRKLTLKTDDGEEIILNLPTYTMPNAKNASGYFVEDDMDAIDLFIGSDGTLGVISQLTIKLLPLPKEIWGISCFFEAENQAIEFVEKARLEIRNIAALEFFDGAALDLLRTQKESGSAFSGLPNIPSQYDCCVYAELHTEEFKTAEEAMFALGEIMQAAGSNPRDTWVARNENDIERLHFFRHAVPESANMIIDQRKKTEPIITKLGADMSVPDAYLKDVMALYRTTLREANLESATWGHIGNNHLHVNILPRNKEDFYKGKALYASWAEQVTKMGGAVSAEHGVGKIKAEFLRVMYGPEAIEEMEQVKYTLDSKGLLGRGNLFEQKKGGE